MMQELKLKTDIYKRLVVTIDEISEEKGNRNMFPGLEEKNGMFLDDLEIVNTAESEVY